MTEEMQEMRVVSYLYENGEALKMQVFREIEVDGKTLGLLIPHHDEPIVTILHTKSNDEDAELAEFEPEDFPKVSKEIQKALSEWGCKIVVRADEFVILGDPPEEFWNEYEIIEVETDAGDDELWVLMEIDTGEDVYLIVTASLPPIFTTEIFEDDTARSLSDAQVETHKDLFKRVLEEAGIGGED